MQWYRAESAALPPETDTESSKAYDYVRRNIEETEKEVDGETVTAYTYEETKIPKESRGIYNDLVQAQADIDYLNMITEDL